MVRIIPNCPTYPPWKPQSSPSLGILAGGRELEGPQRPQIRRFLLILRQATPCRGLRPIPDPEQTQPSRQPTSWLWMPEETTPGQEIGLGIEQEHWKDEDQQEP
jgi:hypothetical protein